MALLSARQGAADDGVELRRGPEQESPLNASAGDLYQAVGLEKMTDLASHAHTDEERDDDLAVIE